ncbi:MAG TPA: class I SAM-dependent methyltransferase [Candidatus Bathyarchaeia archaeon]|nr:class I SAM-dependent methyltransferase [Candidatus Bathyarchaeia archaeon]
MFTFIRTMLDSSKNRIDCFYCQDIQKEEQDYPIRKGKYSFEGIVTRCLWHAEFQCSECQRYYHFSYLYWCPSTNKIICGKCNKPTFHPIKFWNKTYAYAFTCKDCGEVHYDLLYSEFSGNHPWQVDKDIFFKKERPLNPILKTHFPWEPIWKPTKNRTGKELTIEEALKIENKVFNYLKEFSLVTLHSEQLTDDQIDLAETKARWEKTSYNWISKQFENKEDKGDSSREFIIDPALWIQLGDVKGLKILDAGCGNGYLSRQLAKKGADVVGVDFTQNFIGYCKKREKENPLGCKFYCESLTDLSFIEDESFDMVVSNVVMVDVQDYKTAFKEINRILKPKGRFVWSNLHPTFGSLNQIFFRVPYDTPRNEERLFVLLDRYFDSGAILTSWGNIKPIWQFHRTLQEYTQALFTTGFLIREIIEPKPSLEDIKNNPRTLAFDADRIPIFIIYDCIKVSAKRSF